MFTGIIIEEGKINSIDDNNGSLIFKIETKKSLKGKKVGESIAVNGCCLTIVSIDGNAFICELMNETIRSTNFSELNVGDKVNLEPALIVGQSMDGHMVQGHIDSVGNVDSVKMDGNSKIIGIRYENDISKFIVYKGSICVNGVSLTVSLVNEDYFEISLIPHTLENTNLNVLLKGDKVNLEVDVMARYIENLMRKND